MKFRVKGVLKFKEVKEFSKLIEAASEKLAVNRVYSFFGNTYRLPRRRIAINEVKSV